MAVSNVLVHFYRASVMHADIWRQRMDATTNWAVVSAGAVITFDFSQPSNPHFVLLIAGSLVQFFLIMEARRYQHFHLWAHRVRTLQRHVIVPELMGADWDATNDRESQSGLRQLAREMASNAPLISLADAVGFRLTRTYLFVFTTLLASWLLKLWYHPKPCSTFDVFVERASIGEIPGPVVLLSVAVGFTIMIVLSLRATTERIESWIELPSPVSRVIADPFKDFVVRLEEE